MHLTERLQIEPLESRHASELHAVLSDPEIYRFIPQEPPSLDQLEKRYKYLERRTSPDGTVQWLNWALRQRETGNLIGTIQATVLPDKTAMIAYELGPGYWGQGYATEALKWLLDSWKETGEVNSTRAYVDTRNKPSIRLLERLGFERIDAIKDADFFKGESSDEYVYYRSIS
jgi:RimJ/RimL family protein N-acetyltransferase